MLVFSKLTQSSFYSMTDFRVSRKFFYHLCRLFFLNFLSSFLTDLGWKWHYLFIQGILLPLILNKWHILIHLCKPSNLISYHIIEKMRKGRIGNWISQMGMKKKVLRSIINAFLMKELLAYLLFICINCLIFNVIFFTMHICKWYILSNKSTHYIN